MSLRHSLHQNATQQHRGDHAAAVAHMPSYRPLHAALQPSWNSSCLKTRMPRACVRKLMVAVRSAGRRRA